MYAPTLEQMLTEAGVLPIWEARWEERGKAEGKAEERAILQGVIADKDAEIARLRAQLESINR